MQIVGDFVVVVEVGKNQDRQIKPRIQQTQLSFLKLPAALLQLEVGLDYVGMRHFPAAFKILSKFEEAFALVCCFLRREQLLLSGGHGVKTLNDGDNESARSDFCPRARYGRSSRGVAKTRDAREVQGFVHVALADVFVYGVVGDVAYAIPGAVALRSERLRGVVHAGKQCGRRLVAILTRNGGVRLSRLKLRAVFARKSESILQRHTERLGSGRSCLL